MYTHITQVVYVLEDLRLSFLYEFIISTMHATCS